MYQNKVLETLRDIVELEKAQAEINNVLQEQIQLLNKRVSLLESEVEYVQKTCKEKSSGS
jgi:hypothetical protein